MNKLYSKDSQKINQKGNKIITDVSTRCSNPPQGNNDLVCKVGGNTKLLITNISM